MEKICNKLLIIAIICAILSYVLCTLNAKTIKINADATQSVYNEVQEYGDEPGTGWYLLIGGGLASMLDFGTIIISVFMSFLPILISIGIVILQLIARLIQMGEKKESKNTASKVLSYISISLYSILCLNFLFMLPFRFSFISIGLLSINVICLILFIIILVNSKKNNTETVDFQAN